MNILFLLLIGVPAIEIFIMIKVGQNIGAPNTISLIFLTAIIGIYFAKITGLNTLRSAIYKLRKNKDQIPLFEIISGASIAFAALLLIIPGFITDVFGFLLLIGIPAIEIFIMIKVGQNIGAPNTISLIFLTAIIGIYFAKITGLNTLRSAIYKLRKNKDQIPLFEIISGASIAFAALLLIIPGFITDVFGFLLLMPFTRNMLTNLYLKKKPNVDTGPKDYIDGEVIKKEEDKNKDDL